MPDESRALGARFGEGSGVGEVVGDAHLVTGERWLAEAEDLHGRRGSGRLDRLALVVDERLHLAEGGAGDDGVADREEALLHHDGGDRAATDFEVGLEDGADGATGGTRRELGDLGDEQDLLEQFVDAGALERRDLDDDRVAAPLLGHQPVLTDLLEHAVGIGVGLVHLVDRDDERHVGRLGVIDRFDGLGHDAVVGRDHQDDDVGDLGAARAHRGEGFVTGRVDEGDRLALPLHLVGTDVLGDAARFAGDDVGLADLVEQQRLAVVDVTHDGDDRRSRRRRESRRPDRLRRRTSRAARPLVAHRDRPCGRWRRLRRRRARSCRR